MQNRGRGVGVVNLVFSPLRPRCSGLSDLCVALSPPSSAQPPESSRMAQCAALAVEEAPAGDRVKRGGACPCPQWTLCVHRGRCFLSPATHTEPPAGVLAGLQVAAMPTRNSCSLHAPAPRLLVNLSVRLPRNSTAGAPTVSAPQPPASHLPDHPRTRWRSRSKTPTAAHRLRR